MTTVLENYQHIYAAAKRSEDGQRCCVSPSPEAQDKLRAELKRLRESSSSPMAHRLGYREQQRVGFNDGLTVPGTELPLGAPPSVARSVAMKKTAKKSGSTTMNVAVVLVQFSDKSIGVDRKQYFADLFFSTGKIATGSVKEYFKDVTGNKVNIAGQVVGPYSAAQVARHLRRRRLRHRQSVAQCPHHGARCRHPCRCGCGFQQV